MSHSKASVPSLVHVNNERAAKKGRKAWESTSDMNDVKVDIYKGFGEGRGGEEKREGKEGEKRGEANNPVSYRLFQDMRTSTNFSVSSPNTEVLLASFPRCFQNAFSSGLTK